MRERRREGGREGWEREQEKRKKGNRHEVRKRGREERGEREEAKYATNLHCSEQ